MLIVKVMHLLVQHRCGALVIEEAQEQNLAARAFAREFLNFFLRILNWGVPVVLVGNPLAFTVLKTHAQDVDRFSDGGWQTLLPEKGCDSRVWKMMVRALWMASWLAPPLAPFEPVARHPRVRSWPEYLWQLSGGLPRHLSKLHLVVQVAALKSGKTSTTSGYVEEVFHSSPHFTMLRDRISAFANHDIAALQAFVDIPTDLLRRHWATDQAVPEIAAGVVDGAGLPSESVRPKVGRAEESISSGLVPEGDPGGETSKNFQRKLCNDLRRLAQQSVARRRAKSKVEA